MPNWTKQELEEEVESLRSSLEEVLKVASDVLGYEDPDTDDNDDPPPDDE